MQIAGGRDHLRSRLGVNDHSINLWLNGKARIPDRVFLVVADIVLQDDIARAAEDRRRRPRAPNIAVVSQAPDVI